jgi:pimeloyl-ACP methyl ester carboxylesterase
VSSQTNALLSPCQYHPYIHTHRLWASRTTIRHPFYAYKEDATFFVHGGFGSAAVWPEYMMYFSQHGIPCYALSLHGHGNSWYPSLPRMLYRTTKRMLANDLVAGVEYVQELESEKRGEKMEVVLVGIQMEET